MHDQGHSTNSLCLTTTCKKNEMFEHTEMDLSVFLMLRNQAETPTKITTLKEKHSNIWV